VLLKDHTCCRENFKHIRYERRAALDSAGAIVTDLFDAWIWLDNPAQMNSYTTETLRELNIAIRQASSDRAVVSIVITGTGDRAFCSGGNTKEYSEYYAGRPAEYKQYMRLFNDLITGLLLSDKPVINRVNGLRIAGGQEIGLACDFTIASDLARFGQAGPRHGSAPDGGSTDFLHLYIGIGLAIESCTLCEPWSAYKALRLGLVNQVVPVLSRGGRFIPNPAVVTNRWLDDEGGIAYGESVPADALPAAKAIIADSVVDFSRLDGAVAALSARLLQTMPDCLSKTLESLRKKKLEHWQRNSETNRSWLALNMMTEGSAGFRAFNDGPPGRREVDFAELRRRLARGERWSDELAAAVQPGATVAGRQG
jgi:6-oxo-cyclohex-1-ene-carbonyl-CoA hydrolase